MSPGATLPKLRRALDLRFASRPEMRSGSGGDQGIYWDVLSPQKLSEIKVLQELKRRIEEETGEKLPVRDTIACFRIRSLSTFPHGTSIL